MAPTDTLRRRPDETDPCLACSLLYLRVALFKLFTQMTAAIRRKKHEIYGAISLDRVHLV